MSERIERSEIEESRNVLLAAPARFFVEIDSILSMIVHRYGRGIAEDVKQDAKRLYYEARSVYAGPIPTTIPGVERLEREMEFKSKISDLLSCLSEICEDIEASPEGLLERYGIELKHLRMARHVGEEYAEFLVKRTSPAKGQG